MVTNSQRPAAGQARPNYNAIHASPLPLKTYPLPTLIPHNPLSILHILFVFIRQTVQPPSSHPSDSYVGYFSTETRSVHITDPSTIRFFWENGFFGKGTLSRSEPSWLEREKRKQGWIVSETSEEITQRRREERKEFKKERARKEREAIELRLREERGEITQNDNVTTTFQDEPSIIISNSITSTKTMPESPAQPATEPPVNTASLSSKKGGIGENMESLLTVGNIQNQEHLQWNLEEAFFLAYALGVLKILSPSTHSPISVNNLLPLFAAHSVFPPLDLPLSAPIVPDNNFLVSYVAYHHFRSLGWVVRPGVKFAVDLLLYKRGPVFSHAEFAVIILPAYSDSYWNTRPEERKKTRPWHWLHMVNRVQTQVRKSLVLCYVEIPRPVEIGKNEGVCVKTLLKRYKVREIIVRRWIPNRSRD